MELPPRPLRLHPEFVRRSWLRVLGAFAPMLAVFAVAGLWQGRAAWSLAMDERVWATGEVVPVEVGDVSVSVIAGLVRHVRLTVTGDWPTGHGDETARFRVVDDYYTFFTDSVGDGPLVARRDLDEGRVALSWSMQDRVGRWAWLVIFGLVFIAFGGVLGRLAWRALETFRVARAAAIDGEPLELEVVSMRTEEANGQPWAVTVAYRLPPAPRDGPVSYRDRASERGDVRVETLDLADGAPIVLDGARVLALRPKGWLQVTLLREGHWPFQGASDPHVNNTSP